MTVPASRKRIFIVDDAVVVRKSLSDVINQDPALEVAATAANGRVALAKYAAARPDRILLDIEMPEMDGLTTLEEIRKMDPRVPIIMFSTLSERGAAATLEALSLGASDYVPKPSNTDMATTLMAISSELLPKIRALCRIPAVLPASARPTPPRICVQPRSRMNLSMPARVIGIGVSTGGPDALARLLPTLPAKLPVAVLIAQHMPALFTSLLARRLASRCELAVRECESGEAVTPGTVYLAPGDYHMIVAKEDGVVKLRTHQGPKENFCRPSVDVLFRSVAAVYEGRALGVILTGMGQDGLKGCEELDAHGSRIVAQDEASSVVWGMPAFVARAGLADKILPLDQIGAEMVRAAGLT